MTKPCKFKNGACVHCGSKSRLNAHGEKCEGWNAPDQSLPERCNSQADKLDQLAEQFEQLGWEGHRLKIVDLAGHLRIYAHQIKAKLEESK